MKAQDMKAFAESLPSPAQILDEIRLPQLREFMASGAMGEGLMKRDGRPEWVIRAAQETWRLALDIPKSSNAKSESYALGFGVGLAIALPRRGIKHEPNLDAMFSPKKLKELIPLCVANSQTQDTVDFCRGIADGTERAKVFNPGNRCVVYMILCIRWQEVVELKNIGEVHTWLGTIIKPNLVGERERIAKICQKIGLRFADKGGRPKKPRKDRER